MKSLPLLATLSICTCLLLSCSSSRNSSETGGSKKNKITGVHPNVNTPSAGVINASGDALTPGINSANKNGPGSEENAAAIANTAINKANLAVKNPLLKLDTLTGQDFINRISATDSREIKMDQMAIEKSRSQKIKDYAVMSIKDHQLLQDDLNKLSTHAGVKETEVIVASLQSLKASAQRSTIVENDKTDFVDIEYIQMTIENQQNMIRLLEAASRSKDASISAFANKHLPVLRQNLSAAQELTKK